MKRGLGAKVEPKQAFNDLIAAARGHSRESRSLLAQRINEICLMSGRQLSPREAALLFDILEKLILEVELSVRKQLSSTLSEREDTPRDLARMLANDVIDVAYPMLVKSKVLEDGDLIQVILDKATEHQVAITKRDTVSEQVSDSLIGTGNKPVVRALLQNEGARIEPEALSDLVEQAMDDPDLQEPLVRRKDLPEDLAMRMYNWVGEALRKHIEERFHDEALPNWTEADDAVSTAVREALREDIFAGELAGDGDDDPAFHSGNTDYRPHPRTLVKALKDGDIYRFEELFRDLTDLNAGSVAKVLYDSGPEAIAIACKATGVDREVFAEILALLQGGGNPANFRQQPAFLKTMDYFDRIDRQGASRVLTTWRSAPDDRWGR